MSVDRNPGKLNSPLLPAPMPEQPSWTYERPDNSPLPGSPQDQAHTGGAQAEYRPQEKPFQHSDRSPRQRGN